MHTLQSQATSAFIVFPVTLAVILQLQLSVIPAWTPLVRGEARASFACVRNHFSG